MKTNVATYSNYNFYELMRDVLNGPNGRFLISCLTGSATFISLALIFRGCDFKSEKICMSIPSIYN